MYQSARQFIFVSPQLRQERTERNTRTSATFPSFTTNCPTSEHGRPKEVQPSPSFPCATHSLTHTRAPQKSITLNQIRRTSWCLFNRYLTQSDVLNGTRAKAVYARTHTHKDMTHFPERRSQLHSYVATACHLKLTTCFITHSDSPVQGDALAPRSEFYVTYFLYDQ
jgi:hypothetical protein